MNYIIFFPIIALVVYFSCYYLKEYFDDKPSKEELKQQQETKDKVYILRQDPNATIKDLEEIYYPKRMPI